jgi:hypothetical protein
MRPVPRGYGCRFRTLDPQCHRPHLDCSYCHESTAEGSGGVSINFHNSTLRVYEQDNSYNCYVCHQNTTDLYGATDVYAHTANTNNPGTANVTTNASDCGWCHMTGGRTTFTSGQTLHGTNLRQIPTSSAWGTSNANCNPCHNSSEGGWSTVANAVNHTAEMLGNSTITCAFCHETGSIGKGSAATTSIMVHNSTLEKNATKYNCTSCHTATANRLVNDSRIIKTHYPGAGVGEANTTDAGYGCEDCHNTSGRNLHSQKLVVDKASISGNANGTCYGCHNVDGTFQNKSTIIYSNPVHRKDYTTNASQACDRCHNYNGTDRFHFNDYPQAEVVLMGDLGYTGNGNWTGWTTGTAPNCTECHINKGSMAPFWATNVSNGSLKGNVNQSAQMGQFTQTDCIDCHVNVSGSGVDSYKTHRVKEGAGGECATSTCHSIASGSNQTEKVINVTAFNDSGHSNLNIDNGSNGPCYACHGDGEAPPEGEHTTDYNNSKTCDDCHTNESVITVIDEDTGNGTGLFNASWISDHTPYSSDTNTTNATCEGCHIQAVVSGSTGNISNENQNVSHYLVVPVLKDSKTTNNCSYCHKPPSEGGQPDAEKFSWGIPDDSNIANTTMGGSDEECWVCHSSRNLELQTGEAPQAPNNFHENTLTNFQWSCQYCHPE